MLRNSFTIVRTAAPEKASAGRGLRSWTEAGPILVDFGQSRHISDSGQCSIDQSSSSLRVFRLPPPVALPGSDARKKSRRAIVFGDGRHLSIAALHLRLTKCRWTEVRRCAEPTRGHEVCRSTSANCTVWQNCRWGRYGRVWARTSIRKGHCGTTSSKPWPQCGECSTASGCCGRCRENPGEVARPAPESVLGNGVHEGHAPSDGRRGMPHQGIPGPDDTWMVAEGLRGLVRIFVSVSRVGPERVWTPR